MGTIETKKCLHCEIEKDIDDFGRYTKRNGSIGYRNVCKVCKEIQDKNTRAKKKMKNDTNTINKPVKIENIKPEGNNKIMNIFTNTEIEKIRDIITLLPELKKIINNKIELNKIEDVKIKKSISISESIHKKVLELSNKSNLNYSQVVESLLKSALENI